MGLQIDENQSKYQIFNLLNELPFFDNFDDSEKREFVSSENYVLTVDSGSKIVTQGSIEFSLYFLLEGKVIITKNEFPRLVVATLGPGAIFGEISILSQSPRTSNYIARDEVKVLKLNGELFEKLSPPTQIKLNQQLIQVLIDQLESNSFSFLKLNWIIFIPITILYIIFSVLLASYLKNMLAGEISNIPFFIFKFLIITLIMVIVFVYLYNLINLVHFTFLKEKNIKRIIKLTFIKSFKINSYRI
ncbi:MAG: cyclic nucleotide-binding domain-containing protein, partial [Nitrospinae bacterium]|nr:cyclic nucleotide-binding domain-containing protein [Nitrospinota bacterium]